MRRARRPDEDAVAALAENAGRNGVDVELLRRRRAGGSGRVDHRPRGLHAGAGGGGGAPRRAGADGLSRSPASSAEGGALAAIRAPTASGVACRVVVNCAGLGADEVAASRGDERFEIYPRKGEFLVFEPPAASRSIGSSCRCPRRGRRACSSSRPSTARSSPARPRSTAPTRSDWSVRPTARERDPSQGRRRCSNRSPARSRSPPTRGCGPPAGPAGDRSTT